MRIVRLAMSAALFLAPAFAQTFTVLLQRAIFLEETAGDLDGAIQLYRQILSTGGDARVYEAEAQYRLGACLLKKGDKPLAARLFQELMQKHPEEKSLVAKAGIHYVDRTVGYSFTVPEGWTIHPRNPYNQGPGTCVDLDDPESKATVVICAKPERMRADGIRSRLIQGQRELAHQRRLSWPGFKLRSSRPTEGMLGGARTLTVIADYPIGTGQMTEWDTWVESETTRSSVIVHIRAQDFAGFQLRFEPILNSYRIP